MTEWNHPPRGGANPTLNDVLKKILQQFKSFKGGPVLILVTGVVVLVVLWTSWFTVQPEETGIVQRFGKVMRTAGPGLHFKLPYGIEKVRMLPTARVLKEEFGFRTVSVSTVPGEKTRYDTRGAYKVYDRMISERKRIAAKFRSEGEGRSAEILGTMEKELRQIRSTAYRQVQEVQGKADAEATQIYGRAYNKNPEFYAFLSTLESYKEKTNKNSVLILTTDSDFYQYIKQATPGE